MPTARIKLFQLTFQSRDDAPDGAPYGTKPLALVAQLAAARASLSSVNVGFALRDAVEGNDIETIKPLDAIETLDDLTDDETLRLAEGVTGFRSDIYEAWADVDVFTLTQAIRATGAMPVVFTVEDVAPHFNGTEAEAAEWLENTRGHMEDALTQLGNGWIEDTLLHDGKFADSGILMEDEADEEEAAMRERGVTPEAFAEQMADHTAFIFGYGGADTAQIRDDAATRYATLDSIRAVPGFRRAVIFEVRTEPDERGFYEVVKVHPRH